VREAVLKRLPARIEKSRVLVAKRRERDVAGVPKGAWASWKYHKDFEFVDEVLVKTVPRYKMSELSGDEWRVSGLLQFYCKGMLVYEDGFRNVATAITAAPWMLKTFGEQRDRSLLDAAIDKVLGDLCFQPGCAEPAEYVYQIKTEYSREGFTPREETKLVLLRAFCERHSTRGDCGLEDADANYVVLESPELDEPRAPTHKRSWTG